jgi:hypothetical protein
MMDIKIMVYSNNGIHAYLIAMTRPKIVTSPTRKGSNFVEKLRFRVEKF